VRVELYADGVNGGDPVRQEMKSVRRIDGAPGGYVYGTAVSAVRPQVDFTARLIPHCDGVAIPLEDARICGNDKRNAIMTRHNIPVGRILGIPIGLDYSWFVIFGLLTWMLAGSYYPAEFKNWPPLMYWLVGAATALMLFVSVLLHELGHSVVALRYNIPVRSITLFLFGGVAQIGAEPPSAVAEFLIAIAGPLVSLTLAAVFYAVEPLVAGMEPLLGLVKIPCLHQPGPGAV